MPMETQDIIKRSATNSITPPPQARDYKAEVAKLDRRFHLYRLQGLPVAYPEWNVSAMKLATASGCMTTCRSQRQVLIVMRLYRNEQNGKLEWLDSQRRLYAL